MDKKTFDEIRRKYTNQIRMDLEGKSSSDFETVNSTEYLKFKKEYISTSHSLYEKLCNLCEKTLKITPGKNDVNSLKRDIEMAHLSITPTGAMSFSILIPLFFILISIGLQWAITSIVGAELDLVLLMFFLIMGLVLMVFFQKIPRLLANRWRIKASNQIVIAVFYLVTFMRNVSNLEVALRFAADHMGPPLSLDYRRILWHVENGNVSLKDALEDYLDFWKATNMGYVEAFHLIMGSLYEENEQRRLQLLNKSIQVMLDDTYDSMLHFAQNLKSPLNAVYMLGITLPVFSLILLPLMVNMIGVKWYHLALIYDVVLPLLVSYEATNILSLRPGGITDINIKRLGGKKIFKKVPINLGFGTMMVNPWVISFMAFVVLFLIGLSPIIYHAYHPNYDFSLFGKPSLKFFDYRNMTDTDGNFIKDSSGGVRKIGPFGIGAMTFSLILTYSFAVLFGLYFYLRTKSLMKIRNNTKKIENEFQSAIYELGNKLGDGFPVEVAIDKTGKELGGTPTGKFFNLISQNLLNGFGIKEAIFNKKVGAILFYPSSIIESVMKLLLESAKKGPIQASNAMITFSEYLRKIRDVQERLRDLMSEVISSMKAQINYLTPLITGIVMALSSLMSLILGQIKSQIITLKSQSNSSSAAGASSGNLQTLATMFGNGVPLYQYQLVLGIFVIEIIWIMSDIISLISTNGSDIDKEAMIGKSLLSATLLYVIVSLALSVVFDFIGASTGLGNLSN